MAVMSLLTGGKIVKYMSVMMMMSWVDSWTCLVTVENGVLQTSHHLKNEALNGSKVSFDGHESIAKDNVWLHGARD